jgi:DNA-binding transcriptional MerR regulator
MGRKSRKSNYLGVSEAAELTGLTQRTLRFYEEKGLVPPPTRLESGFRLYSEDDLERIRHIRQLREVLDFSLADIKEMAVAEEVRTSLRGALARPPSEDVLEKVKEAIRVTQSQLDIINEKIAGLTEMHGKWLRKIERYRIEADKTEAEQTSDLDRSLV